MQREAHRSKQGPSREGPRVTRLPSRDALLDTAAAALLERGLNDSSLRVLGDAIGVSARMLLYHFGSKESFLGEVFDRIRVDEYAAMEEILREVKTSEPPSKLLERVWRRISRPEFLRLVRLYAEVNARELTDPDAFGGFGRRIRVSWHEMAERLVARYVEDPEERRDIANVVYATLRGLQLDACAAGDDVDVNGAAQVFGRWLDQVALRQARSAPAAEEGERAVAQAWLDAAGGRQRWLCADAVALDRGDHALTLRLEARSELREGDVFRPEVVRAFVDLAADAGAALLCDGGRASGVRIDELGIPTGSALEAHVTHSGGPSAQVVDVRIEGEGPIALGRAGVRR